MKAVTILFLLLNVFALSAYDFEAAGKYYNIINENEVEITFKDTLYNSYLDTSIIIPNAVNYREKEYKVVKIGEFSFTNCCNLNSVIIPESVTKIGKSAFQNCENLVKIDFPQTIETIGKYAFAVCKSISSVTIPPKVKIIEEATFLACENLEYVELSDSLNQIEAIAFMMCGKLKQITIPKGIGNLGACAIFYECENLESIKILAGEPPVVNPMLIQDVDLKRCTLLVPNGCKKRYKEAEVWNEFVHIEEF